MIEHPILFNGPMVRAILEGRKTVTRRIRGLDDLNLNMPEIYRLESISQKSGRAVFSHGEKYEHSFDIRCPYGEVGNRLWVRESFQVSKKYDRMPPSEIPWSRGVSTYFAAGGSRAHNASGAYVNEDTICVPDWVGKMRPSIHMPRQACRILLEVVSIKVERLTDISYEDAAAEGVYRDRMDHMWTMTDEGGPCHKYPQAAFRDLWISTGGDWDANPWVWAIEFKVVQ